MTERYAPAKGDEVEVTLRGTVHRVGTAMFSLHIGGAYSTIPLNNDRVLSVEKVRPKIPTAYSSVVQVTRPNGITSSLIRGADGWRWASGTLAPPFIFDEYDVEVLYDAGVTSDRNNTKEK